MNIDGDEVSHMKKILLTGFKPFLQYSENPTEQIVKSLHNKRMNSYKVIGEVLPVEFKMAGDLLVKYIKEHKPNVVVSLGIAAGRSKITPERIAINCNDGSPDNDGYKPDNEKIVDSAPDGLFSTLPIENIVKNLNENNFPAKISNTAGTYLCNNVMYRSLHYIHKNKLAIKSGFIHIPLSHKLAIEGRTIPSWSLEDLTRGIEISLRSL